MYYLTTRGQNTTVMGALPMTADEVLAFIEQAKDTDLTVEVRDEDDRVVPIERLRREAQGPRPN